MKRSFFIIIIIGIFYSLSYPQSAIQKLAFIGTYEECSPALSRTFDRLLRNQLESAPEISLVGNEKTMYYKEYLRFPRYRTIDKERIALLEKSVTDSLFLLWGDDIKIEIQPLRKNIWGCVLKGICTIHLTLYNITSKSYIYSGTMSSEIHQPTKPLFFFSPEKVVHISSSERTSIDTYLLTKVIDNSVTLVRSLIRNNISPMTTLEPPPEQQGKNAPPSISDVFTMPSVEPPKIDGLEENESGKKTNSQAPEVPKKSETVRNSSITKTK